MLEQVLFLIENGKRVIDNEKGKKQIHKNHVAEKEDRLMVTTTMMIITIMAMSE